MSQILRISTSRLTIVIGQEETGHTPVSFLGFLAKAYCKVAFEVQKIQKTYNFLPIPTIKYYYRIT